MKVAAVFTQGVETVEPEECLADAAERMVRTGIGSLVVVSRQGWLAGILTERDVMRAVADGLSPRATPVAAYMSTAPASAELEEEVSEAAMRMLELGVRHLPVVQGRRVIGMLSVRDVLMLEAWRESIP